MGVGRERSPGTSNKFEFDGSVWNGHVIYFLLTLFDFVIFSIYRNRFFFCFFLFFFDFFLEGASWLYWAAHTHWVGIKGRRKKNKKTKGGIFLIYLKKEAKVVLLRVWSTMPISFSKKTRIIYTSLLNLGILYEWQTHRGDRTDCQSQTLFFDCHDLYWQEREKNNIRIINLLFIAQIIRTAAIIHPNWVG